VKTSRILVWDLPLRVFHWLLAISFAGALLTAESERVRDIHVLLGYTVVGLLGFRILWGFLGTRHARWSSFAYGPKAVLAYLRSLLTREPAHYVGHNPAGSWVIYALVALGLVTGISGYGVYADVGGKWIESLHEGAADAMLALVLVHVAGVVVSSLAHGENLVAAMLTGRKLGQPREAIGTTRWATAVALAAGVAVLWSGAVGIPGVPASTAQTAQTTGTKRHGDDRPGPHRKNHRPSKHES
jgi:cytochrome b